LHGVVDVDLLAEKKWMKRIFNSHVDSFTCVHICHMALDGSTVQSSFLLLDHS
jgi:hypothetical protein